MCQFAVIDRADLPVGMLKTGQICGFELCLTVASPARRPLIARTERLKLIGMALPDYPQARWSD